MAGRKVSPMTKNGRPGEAAVEARAARMMAMTWEVPGLRLRDAIAHLRKWRGRVPKIEKEVSAPFLPAFQAMAELGAIERARAAREAGTKLAIDPWARDRGALQFVIGELKRVPKKLEKAEAYLGALIAEKKR